ncbi:MAG TPA: hypothetical protein VD968_19090 [Pyrinomonadaceae bacterium]|nr:hypothetical protein [Pyrinomonadaceae bacterium]
MKALGVLLSLAFSCAAALAQAQPQQAQAAAAPPDVVVIKFSWDKERLNWEGDPFGGPNENFDQMRVRMRNEKRILDAKAGGNQVELNKVEREARADSANIERIRAKAPARYGFTYKVTVQNNGARAVKAVDWDYVFTDAATGAELGRHQFTSEEKIGPGKKKEFSFFISSPPTQTVSAQSLNKKERDGLAEQVVVVRVLYDDGTAWQPSR